MNEQERHKNTRRNLILNQTLTDLETIINAHDPEVDTSISNGVWDRLDKMAVEIEKLTDTRLIFMNEHIDGHLEGPFNTESDAKEAANGTHVKAAILFEEVINNADQ